MHSESYNRCTAELNSIIFKRACVCEHEQSNSQLVGPGQTLCRSTLKSLQTSCVSLVVILHKNRGRTILLFASCTSVTDLM